MSAQTPVQPPSAGPVRYIVARAEDIPEGERLIVEVGGREIGIFNVGGTFHALLHRCPHASGPLCSGPLQNHVYADKPGEVRMDPDKVFLACPFHGWLFDLESGQSWWDPGTTRARCFPVEVTHGDVVAEQMEQQKREGERVRGPYVAEVFGVDVEDDYVVVTMRARVNPAPTDASP